MKNDDLNLDLGLSFSNRNDESIKKNIKEIIEDYFKQLSKQNSIKYEIEFITSKDDSISIVIKPPFI